MNKPLVSVIVPIYNVEKYIGECIDSILAQTWDNTELILVDDCGSDSSITIAENKVSEYCGVKQIKIIRNNTNIGVAGARNSGIAVAKGDFLFFVDPDDYLCDDEAISKMVRRQQATGADVVAANSIMFDDVTGKIFKVADKDYLDSVYEDTEDKPDYHMGDTVWNRLIRTDFIKQHDLFFDEGIVYEDAVWVFKLICSSPRLATMSDRLYRYRYRSGSIMNTLTKRHIMSRVLIPIICGKWLSEHPTSKKTYATCATADTKVGAFLNLMQTGNQKFCNPIFQLYKKYIPQIKSGKATTRERLKIMLSRVPMPLYLMVIHLWEIRISKKRPKMETVKLDDTFIEEINCYIAKLCES